MTPADDIAVTQLRNRLEQAGDMVASAVRDAYARGLADGLARARAERERQVTATERCSQCGQPWSARACGPTHAMIWRERLEPAERRPTTV